MRVVLALLLCACGRIGFDSAATSSDAIERDSFAGLCAFDRHVVISDGIAADEATGVTLSTRLAQGCAKAPATRTVQQDDPGILDAAGRPTIANTELACIGGGDGPNRAIAYLLAADTPLTWTGTTPVTIRERATNRLIAMGDATPSHDYAFIMVVVDRIGGVYVLSAQGLATNGTRAAAYWFTNMMSPAIANDTRVWTVVEWTNADADPQPSAGDTFVVLGSG